MDKTRKIKKKQKFLKTGKINQCQCDPHCKNKTSKNSYFCTEHLHSCNRRSPLSGYEPEYEPDVWNKNFKVKNTHNCTMYAFNAIDPKQMKKCSSKDCSPPFPQPGKASGYGGFKSGVPKTCPNLMARILGDIPNIIPIEFEQKCPPGTSKVALIGDEDEDYHWVRQDRSSNNEWSHKPGGRNVTNLDASGKKIYDPRLADFDYRKHKDGYLNYDNFCSYMCVPRITPINLQAGGKRTSRKKKRKL